MRVYLTGANGYLGGAAITFLGDFNHDVYGVSSRGDVRIYGPQIPPLEALSTADVIVYLAWYSSAGNDHPAIHEFCTQKALRMIYNLHRFPNLKQFIFASTTSVYGEKNERVHKEGDRLAPNCDYTRGKVSVESALAHQSLPWLSLRFGSLMGRGLIRTKTELVVNSMAVDGYLRKEIKVWSPEAWKPVIHVNDAGNIIARIVSLTETAIKPPLRGPLNVAAESVQALWIAHEVAKITGANLQVVPNQTGVTRSCRVDTSRLRELFPRLRYRPIPDTIKEFAEFRESPGNRNIPWDI
jgi:nucleoside-diphosphate-sugar epimerase